MDLHPGRVQGLLIGPPKETERTEGPPAFGLLPSAPRVLGTQAEGEVRPDLGPQASSEPSPPVTFTSCQRAGAGAHSSAAPAATGWRSVQSGCGQRPPGLRAPLRRGGRPGTGVQLLLRGSVVRQEPPGTKGTAPGGRGGPVAVVAAPCRDPHCRGSLRGKDTRWEMQHWPHAHDTQHRGRGQGAGWGTPSNGIHPSGPPSRKEHLWDYNPLIHLLCLLVTAASSVALLVASSDLTGHRRGVRVQVCSC